MAGRFIDHEDDDPILSVVNLIDLFLVIIVILLIVIVKNPLNPFSSSDNVVVIENPGQEDMSITIKDGEELTRYDSSGAIGEGRGVKAGVTYKLPDGKMVYVPN